MTGIYQIDANESLTRRRTAFRARIAYTIAAASCIAYFLISMFLIRPIDEALLPLMNRLVSSVTVDEAVRAELPAILTDAAGYIFICTVPFLLALAAYCFLHGASPEPAVKHGVPKMPFLYIGGAIGLSYALNLIINLLFFSFGDRFLPAEQVNPVTAPGIILYFIQLAVLPAILEEIAFRGIILKHLLPYNRFGAMIFSSLLFGMLHINPRQAIFAAAFGMLLALCYDYTRSIKFTALIHFMNNLISGGIGYAEQYGNPTTTVLLNMFIYAMMGLGVFALVYYIRNGIKKQCVSFIRPQHTGAKLSLGRSMLHCFTNAGTIILLGMYCYIIYLVYYSK